MSSEKVQGKTSSRLPPESKGNTFWDKLPPWISSNVRSWKSWKVLLRCWVVTWVCFVIMLPDKSLTTLGNTAFFSLLLSIMLPPNMPVQLFMIVMTTLVLGVALGWAISCAAMKAALTVRDQTLVQQTLQKEVQSATGLANPEALFHAGIFNGDFLDTGSTVIYGVFLGFGCFLFALIRAYAPKLTLMSVFGTIAIDIFCSYSPLFPFAQYTLLNSMPTSVACYMAIALVFIVFAFPETMNHSYLSSSAGLLECLKGMLALQDDVLASDPHDLTTGSLLATKVTMARVSLLTQLQQLVSQKQMLDLEFSWGRWNGEDVQGMLEPMQPLAVRLGALNQFAKLVAHPLLLSEPKQEETDSVSAAESTTSSEAVGDTFLLRQFRERTVAAEAEHHVRLIDLLPIIRELTADLRSAGVAVLAALKDLVICVNTKRCKCGTLEQDARLVELDRALSRLRSAVEDFKTDKCLLLLQPYQHLFQKEDTGLMKTLPMRSLYMAYVFTSNLMTVASAIIALAENVTHTATKRTTAKLWFPKGMRALWTVLSARGGADGENVVGEDSQPEETIEAEDSKRYKLDPDSRPPKNTSQRVANLIHKVYKWTKTPEALFTFRYVVVTIALWLPGVINALIMAQTTMNIYASDQVFNYVVRLGGTFVGAILGMVCWYIGASTGNGNPYGLAAITAAFLLVFMFFRLYSPPQYLVGVLMTGATFTLVLGYSWIDGNLPGISLNVGLRWDITWRRWVLVTIGSAASFILMMLPPKSGCKAVRLRNASTISGLSYLYSHLTSLWLSSAEPSDNKNGDILHQWPRELREKFMAGALIHLEPTLRKETLPHTYVLNPHFISDVISLFFLVAQSLQTGEPLHQAQYKNLSDRLHYHSGYALNELRTVVANLCGEVPLKGFEQWREVYDRSHILV
ncbi:hypothetical protein C8Q80DRAFT_1220068 [Daedaleopsis nitida]|nr:hypothetical protein C8Q80DRAFT_1220068 [Daedaleopsis nitida]